MAQRDTGLLVKLNLYRDTEHRGGKHMHAPEKMYVLDMQRKSGAAVEFMRFCAMVMENLKTRR